MERKRNYSSFSDGINADDEADGFWGDPRLARRLKRRNIANASRHLKHNSGSKNKSTEGKRCMTPNKIHDTLNAEVFVDADYKKYLVSLSSEFASIFSNHRYSSSSDFGGDTMLENMSADNALVNNIKMAGEVDDCYMKCLCSLTVGLPGNSNFSERRLVDSGDSRGDAMVENMSAYDVDSIDDDINYENNLEEESLDVDYRDHLHSLALEDDHNDNSMVSDLDVDAVNGFLKSGNSGEELVGNKFQNNAGVDDDAFNNVDPQSKNISESNNNPLGQSGDSAAGNDWSWDHVPVEFNAVNQSVENGTWDNWYEENAAADANGGSFQSPSANIGADCRDGLDNDDPDYKFFIENLREDGTSYVLEVPLPDGTTLSIKYEQHDRYRVENPNAMRTRQQAADLTERHCKSKLEGDLMDESYKFFLNSMKMERDRVVFVPQSGSKVVYDDDEVSSSDSEVMILDTDPFADEKYTPFVPSRVHVLSDDEGNMGSSRNTCWFRERVIENLKKPFDKKELKRLIHDVSVRKPVEVEGEMRGGRSRIRILKERGNSYLDIHRDLETRITAAGRNEPKVLNLLRGFFFWLQNMVHDGMFKPWEDPACLEVMPQGVQI